MSTEESKKENKGSGIATQADVLSMTSLTKDNVPQLLEIVVAKIAALKPEKKDRKKITESLEHFGKIQDIKRVGILISAHSSLVNREKCYNESAKKLMLDVYDHLKPPVFKVQGHTVSQWIEEIEERVAYLVHAKELDKLKATKKTLESHLSEDLKLQQDLAKIQTSLNSNVIE